MKRHYIRLAGAALCVAALALSHSPGEARNKSARATAAAGIIGLAVGAVIADSVARDNKAYGAPPPASYAPPPPFSPAANVICYSDQRACYYNGGSYSADWTWRVFGR